MKHVIITRLLYPVGDRRFKKRFDMYQRLYDSLQAQTNQNFDIAVLCNRQHAPLFHGLGVIPFFVRDNWTGQREGKYWNCKTDWDNLVGLDMYDIQSNIDSDDYVTEVYVDKIQEVCKGDESIHVHFQPMLHEYATGIIKPMKNTYDENNGSAFKSLYQPNKDNYIYIGQDGHRRMQQYAKKTILFPQGFAFVGIHDDNDSTTINA